MVRRIPWLAIILLAAGSLLLAAACAAQTLRKTKTLCAPSCPPPDRTTGASETGPNLKIVIDDVIFDGPMPPPDSATAQRVIEEIKHHPCINANCLNEILEVPIRTVWQEDGYFRVMSEGKSQVVFEDAQDQHVILTIHVDAGPQYWLGNVAFRTGDPDQPLVFSAGELRPLIPLQEGEVFNVTKIRDGLDAMRNRYKEYGYINFVTTPITAMNDAAQRVSVTFELEQGKQFRIGKVEVHGIDPGRAAALASRLHPGDIFRTSVVENAVKAMAPGLSDDDLFHMLSLRKDEKEAKIAVVVDFRQ